VCACVYVRCRSPVWLVCCCLFRPPHLIGSRAIADNGYEQQQQSLTLTLATMESSMPEFVLFGDSLTEWSFDEETAGFGHFLENKYQDKVRMVNRGRLTGCTNHVDDNTEILTCTRKSRVLECRCLNEPR
jgi:hypothetical protein